MAQRILEPGQIETLAQASVPRIRLPDRRQLFSRRAARLRELAGGGGMGDYLQFIAVLADAQHAAAAELSVSPPDAAVLDRAGELRMPPIHPGAWARPPQWRDTLESLCAAVAASPGFPAAVGSTIAAIRHAGRDWLEEQADAACPGDVDKAPGKAVDRAAAPFLMAALQVHWAALSSAFAAGQVRTLDMPGVCPMCGSLPVASVVYAHSPYHGYRYLHCALCATEWHMVRVQCSQCGASGKSIGYHSLEPAAAADPAAQESAATRAETCDQCRGYRKIFYQEKDPGVEPVADDLASLGLDLLLGAEGYHRASGNPLLWQATEA